MDYSPKLRRIMQQIKDIMIAEDVAGCVSLYEPQISEIFVKLEASWSGMKVEETPAATRFHFRARKEDFNGDVKKRNQVIADTINMMSSLQNEAAMRFMNFEAVAENIKKTIPFDELPGEFRSASLDNN